MKIDGPQFNAVWESTVMAQQLRLLSREALPEAAAIALNETADAITERAKHNVRQQLFVRTPYTINSIRTKNRASGRDVGAMFARTGTISRYLPLQNTGGIVRARRRKVPVPTVAARRGRAEEGKIAGRYAMDKIGNIGSDGRFFIGVPKGGNRPLGLYERHGKNKRLRHLRRLDNTQVRVPESAWFDDAIDTHSRLLGARFRRAAQREITRSLRPRG